MKTIRLAHRTIFSIVLLFSFTIASVSLQAQRKNAPKWIDYAHRTAMFPKTNYVVGFTSERINGSDDLEEVFDRLKNHARIQLVESIIVSIKSITTSDIMVSNTITNEDFRKTSVSLSKVKITGLSEETYYDEKDNICYTLTYAKQSEISELHRNIIKNNLSKIIQKIDEAHAFEQANNNNNALERFYECYPLFREVEEAQSLIIAFDRETTDFPALKFDEIAKQKQIVDQSVSKLQGSSKLNLDELCFIMANSLSLQTQKVEKDIYMGSFTYADSKMSSTFSKRFVDLFETKLTAKGVAVSRINKANVGLENLYLSGTYWEEDDKIKMIAILRDLVSGKAIASAEGFISKEWFTTNNIDFMPANYNNVSGEVNNFYKNDIVSQGGLYVDVTTNRGNDNPVFVNMDTLKLYVRANRKCYIRLIYYFADGSKVLFFDNYYVAADQVNQLIALPEEFECVAPFGIETLQLNAQTKPFSPLNITEQGGVKFINDGTDDIINKVRAFRPIENKDAKAEKRVIITTLSE